jgi:exodeoxyribonuclease VII small subunit
MAFEVKLKRLEEIVQAMENGELALAESLKLFEEGIKLAKECNKNLDEAEQKVKVLMDFDQNGKPITEDFSIKNDN